MMYAIRTVQHVDLAVRRSVGAVPVTWSHPLLNTSTLLTNDAIYNSPAEALPTRGFASGSAGWSWVIVHQRLRWCYQAKSNKQWKLAKWPHKLT